MIRVARWAATALVAGLSVGQALAASPDGAISSLRASGAKVSVSNATGVTRFVSITGKSLGTTDAVRPGEDQGLAFVRANAAAFGIRSVETELQLADRVKGGQGGDTAIYRQMYQGVPVFGAELRTHSDVDGNLRAVTSSFVPEIDVNPAPSIAAEKAAARALASVQETNAAAKDAVGSQTGLYVFRANLVRGIPGTNHLAYEITVTNGNDVREFVYVDAHTGKPVEQFTGIHDALNRRSYDGAFNATAPGPNYPNTPFWVEGNALPSGNTASNGESDRMVMGGGDTYNLFNNAIGQDSFNGAGAIMHAIFNRGWSCPNASWNGSYISFCNGFTTDDITAHEWGHAYTQYANNLIYAWQTGALNESYSDIIGETVDFINTWGTDTPNAARTADSCTVFGGTPNSSVVVNSPGGIAGSYYAVPTNAKPTPPVSVTGDLALANPIQACSAVTGVSGKIAVVDWNAGTAGTPGCGSVAKMTNVFNAGAIGAIIVADPSGLVGLTGNASIAALQISDAHGTAIMNAMTGGTVNATLIIPVGTDNSVRWLMGEDVTPGGAGRDMWNPNCFANPGKVSDQQYFCATTADANTDQGGVHLNSGIPNHVFALLVDGGVYNGQTISGLGLTKAFQIHAQAHKHYTNPVTDFSAHADALTQACSDLVGVNLNDLQTGAPSGQTITAADCQEVAEVIVATQLYAPPPCTGQTPVLAKNPPPNDSCAAAEQAVNIFADDFETGFDGWSTSQFEAYGPGTVLTPHVWVLDSSLPKLRAGTAIFAADPNSDADCNTTTEASVVRADSPTLTVPPGPSPRIAFDHFVATENGWDGGQLHYSVNGGSFTKVPFSAFVYNPYNKNLNNTYPTSTDNPLATTPKAAWSGTDAGTGAGSWGRTIVNMAGLASSGSTVRFRFASGIDGCGASLGWFVDDVRVFQCLGQFSIDDVSVNEAAGSMTFTVSLSGGTVPTSISYAAAAVTATMHYDFQNVAGTLNFPAGASSQTITVPIPDDAVFEGDETFVINLSSPVGAAISDAQGVGTILNDDGAPAFSIADVQVTEVDAGSPRGFVLVAVGVTLSGGNGSATSVDFATANGTAVAGPVGNLAADYVARTGTLAFPAGSTYQQFLVKVWGDNADEGTNDLANAETILVNLTNAIGGPAIGDAQGVISIIDND
jgi:Zn-dependent metalloprotease